MIRVTLTLPRRKTLTSGVTPEEKPSVGVKLPWLSQRYGENSDREAETPCPQQQQAKVIAVGTVSFAIRNRTDKRVFQLN